MSVDEGKQGRRVFGLRRADTPDPEVEFRVRAAEERAQAAESRVGDLQAELVFYGDAIRSLRSELESMAERVVSRVAPQVVELEARNAETDAMREAVAEARSEVDAEREILLAWRKELEQAVGSLRGEMERARQVIDEMPERIRVALTPAAQAMAAVGTSMVSLAGMPVPFTAVRHVDPPAQPETEVPQFQPDPGFDDYGFESGAPSSGGGLPEAEDYERINW
jgi:predicted RNase H-like nuclease (RuvC/YqgF family)